MKRKSDIAAFRRILSEERVNWASVGPGEQPKGEKEWPHALFHRNNVLREKTGGKRKIRYV